MKILMTPFKLLYVLFHVKKDDYQTFKVIANVKHFYDWEWKLLDRIYKFKEELK